MIWVPEIVTIQAEGQRTRMGSGQIITAFAPQHVTQVMEKALRHSSGRSTASYCQVPFRLCTNAVGSRSMAIKRRQIIPVIASMALVLIVESPTAAPQGQRLTQQQHSPVLSRRIARASIPSTTFLKALFEIGRMSDQCMGVVLVQRSSALAEVPNINAQNVTIDDLLAKAMESAKGLRAREEEGCAVVAPVGREPGYLKTIVPSFRTQRSQIELQSYYLFQALCATEPQPVHKGVWGTVSSISASTDSPEVGPMQLKGLSVEAILCKLATTAGSTLWIAWPKKAAETTEPWQFIRYRGSSAAADTSLRLITQSLPE